MSLGASRRDDPVPPSPDARPGRETRHSSWRRRVYLTLRTEHTTPGKVAAAIGLGVGIGFSPFWGLHFAISVLAATLMRLNRVLVYTAANAANPVTAPLIVFAEIQIGHRLIQGAWLHLSVDQIYAEGWTTLFGSFLVGGVILAAIAGAASGGVAYLLLRSNTHPDRYHLLVDDATRRYLEISLRDAEAARGALLGDPIYPHLLGDRRFLDAPRVLDLGCGRALAAVLRGSASAVTGEERRYTGVDVAARYIRTLRHLHDGIPGYEFVECDLRDFDPPSADYVLLIDALRFLPFSAQDALLRRLAKAMPAGACLVVRDVDAAAGWRFRLATLHDFLSLLLPGRSHRPAHYRRAEDLRNALAAAGFSVQDRSTHLPAWGGRILLEAIRRPTALPRGERA